MWRLFVRNASTVHVGECPEDCFALVTMNFPGSVEAPGVTGQVKNSFHTSVHHLAVNGVRHFANFSDPQIPQALAPAVAGIVSLHDFRPHIKAKPAQYTYIYNRQQQEWIAPADLATIYDFNPLFSAGTTGTGQTIVVVEDTDLYSRSDWAAFRSTFGLSKYTSATLVSQHPAAPGGNNNCVAPGVNGADVESGVGRRMGIRNDRSRCKHHQRRLRRFHLPRIGRGDRDAEPGEFEHPARHHERQLRLLRSHHRRDV